MADDARIQRVEELAAYSRHLGSFTESMAKNFVTFNNVMMQKLEVLRKKRDRAEKVEAETIQDYTKAFHEFACCPLENREERRELRARLREAEHKKLAAQRMRGRVNSQYNVARGMVRVMLERSRAFQDKLSNNIGKGRDFLTKTSAQLEQYKDNARKI